MYNTVQNIPLGHSYMKTCWKWKFWTIATSIQLATGLGCFGGKLYFTYYRSPYYYALDAVLSQLCESSASPMEDCFRMSSFRHLGVILCEIQSNHVGAAHHTATRTWGSRWGCSIYLCSACITTIIYFLPTTFYCISMIALEHKINRTVYNF